MRRIMVVGGSGFIGQHVTRLFGECGHEVHATCKSRRQAVEGKGQAARWIRCDLGMAHATDHWPESCDTVLFLAQARRHRDFPGSADDVFAVNIAGLHQTMTYALRAQARRVVYASTGSIYAPAVPLAHETQTLEVAGSRNFYVASKLAAEVLLGPYARVLPDVVLRLFMPYGPGQNADMLFPQLLDKVRSGTAIQLHGQDGLRATPTAVADVAECCRRCLDLERSATLNLAGPEVFTLRQIGTLMGEILGEKPLFEVLSGQAVPSYVGDTTLLRQTLGWAPPTTLAQGLRDWLQPRSYALAS